MEWVELFETLPISNVVILGLAYACWNIYKDTQTVTDRVLETNNQLSQNNAELVKTNAEILSANAQFTVMLNDIQDKVAVLHDRIQK